MLNVNYVGLLERIGLLKYIVPDNYEKAVTELNIITMKFVNNQVIFRQNEKVDQIAIVVDGLVKAEKVHGSGSDNMAHSYGSGELFAYEGMLSGRKVYPMDYISDGDSQIAVIDVENIYNCRYSKEIVQGIFGVMADESINRMHRIEVISKKKLRDRIMTYMRIRADKVGTDAFTLDISREQLASDLCVNRTALSNELSKMQKDGLIYIEKRKIRLIKR